METDEIKDEVLARKFVLVDEEGTSRAILSTEKWQLIPVFVEKASSTVDIVNKNVRHLETRYDNKNEELLFAIEFKLVINSSKNFEDEILKDNKKLLYALDSCARHAVNLVFCNTKPKYEESFHNAIKSAEEGVTAVFIQSYYGGNNEEGKKITPKPLVKIANGKITDRLPDDLFKTK